MVVGFSASDLVELPQFVGMSVFDLIQRSNDVIVASLIYKMGADTSRGVHIQACKHRNVRNKVLVGYRYVAFERKDKEWLSNRHSSMSARISAQKDSTLAGDMVFMSQQGIGENGFKAMCVGVMGSEDKGAVGITRSEIDEDYLETLSLIHSLQKAQENIRGYISEEEDILFKTKL